MLTHILPMLQPVPGELSYVEPFGGSGVVLLNKQPHPSEVYNDSDGELVNLFRVIRDPDGVVHLWWELINTPVSREEFGHALESAKKYSPVSPVARAASFVIRCRQRFGGGQTGLDRDSDRSWGTSRGSTRDMNDIVSRWLSTMLNLPEIHRRFATVVIDHQDAVRCIEQWDGPATLFYVDPPYVGAEEYYQGGFNAEDHQRLAGTLNSCRAKVVLSYYPHPTVNKLYPIDRWHRMEFDVRATACGNFKRDLLTDVPAIKESTERTELVLTNFDPVSRTGGQKNLPFQDGTEAD